MLVREVYGDSSASTIGNNGGSQGAVGLVRKPGSGVPNLFTVYLRGLSTPWDWANGPVPLSRLDEVDRIVLNVTATSPLPDAKGNYSQTTYRTEVASMRNIPDNTVSETTVDGYVYDDRNQDHAFNLGDLPMQGVTVRCGAVLGTTNSLGYYLLNAKPGNWTLRQTAPQGYGVYANSDSVTVNLPPAVTYSFADTAAHGGWVNLTAFEDIDYDGLYDLTELPHLGVRFTVTIDTVNYTTLTIGTNGTVQFGTLSGANPTANTSACPTWVASTPAYSRHHHRAAASVCGSACNASASGAAIHLPIFMPVLPSPAWEAGPRRCPP